MNVTDDKRDTYQQPDPPERWTKIVISDSQDGEVSVMVRKVDLSLTDVMEDLIIPAMKAKGYGGVENWIFDGAGE